jgi:hypothetical protein
MAKAIGKRGLPKIRRRRTKWLINKVRRVSNLTQGVFVELSLFLAKLLGIYFLIVFVLLVTQKEQMIQGFKSFSTNLPLMGFVA